MAVAVAPRLRVANPPPLGCARALLRKGLLLRKEVLHAGSRPVLRSEGLLRVQEVRLRLRMLRPGEVRLLREGLRMLQARLRLLREGLWLLQARLRLLREGLWLLQARLRLL